MNCDDKLVAAAEVPVTLVGGDISAENRCTSCQGTTTNDDKKCRLVPARCRPSTRQVLNMEAVFSHPKLIGFQRDLINPEKHQQTIEGLGEGGFPDKHKQQIAVTMANLVNLHTPPPFGPLEIFMNVYRTDEFQIEIFRGK